MRPKASTREGIKRLRKRKAEWDNTVILSKKSSKNMVPKVIERALMKKQALATTSVGGANS